MQRLLRIAPLVIAASLVLGQPASAFDGCRAVDFNGDGTVNLLDAFFLSEAFGEENPRVDVDGSSVVDDADIVFWEAFAGETCTDCAANLVDPIRPPTVDAADRAALEAAYGRDCRADLDRDGTVDGDGDVALFILYLGEPTGPGLPATRADFDGDGAVTLLDQGVLSAAIGRDCRPDLTKDGSVDTNDLWALLASWGRCS